MSDSPDMFGMDDCEMLGVLESQGGILLGKDAEAVRCPDMGICVSQLDPRNGLESHVLVSDCCPLLFLGGCVGGGRIMST
jgi:hypothetical protein